MYKTFTVELANDSSKTFILNYQIRATPAAQLWANCLERASSSGLRESQRFQNFPHGPDSKIDNLIARLQMLISELQQLHPELEFPPLDYSDLQNSVNALHFNFAHGHNVTRIIGLTNSKIWSDFNNCIHEIESALLNQTLARNSSLTNARVVMTFNSPFKIPVPAECYQDFSLSREFGVAYVNYAQVGRHFLEMFLSKDDSLADEHIQPYRFISADTNLSFGPTLGHIKIKSLETEIKDWFEHHKTRFNRLGYFWDDPQIALGHLPVARLAEPLYSIKEIQRFVKHVAQFNRVQSAQVFDH